MHYDALDFKGTTIQSAVNYLFPMMQTLSSAKAVERLAARGHESSWKLSFLLLCHAPVPQGLAASPVSGLSVAHQGVTKISARATQSQFSDRQL
ncbi:MAG TPA: hypothetical protein VLA04_06080 [Verrucomicrobiae bacterium]|nr:hypothetical protein [Verrucomicrobiae bacterium]